MWEDINHALYTGMDVQRELTRMHKLDGNKAVSPIVFTGIVGNMLEEMEQSYWLDDGEIVERRYWSGQTSQAWIDLQAIEVGDKFMSKWLYVDQLFTQEYVAELNNLYCQLITYLAEHDWEDEADIFQLPVIDQQVIAQANNVAQPLSELTLFSGYEELLQQKPELKQSIAVIDRDRAVNYETLLSDSERLSRYLCHEVQSQSTLVGVLSEKGYNQVITTLSIMKSGHAYLPLHVDWPVARLDAVLMQGNVEVLLVSAKQYACAEVKALGDKYQLLVIEELLSELNTNSKLQKTLKAKALPAIKARSSASVAEWGDDGFHCGNPLIGRPS
jgi:non-ribosomal peptide synthetase component F